MNSSPKFNIGQAVKLPTGAAKVVGIEDGARRLYGRCVGWLYTVLPVAGDMPAPSRLTGLAWPVGAVNATYVPEEALAKMQA